MHVDYIKDFLFVPRWVCRTHTYLLYNFLFFLAAEFTRAETVHVRGWVNKLYVTCKILNILIVQCTTVQVVRSVPRVTVPGKYGCLPFQQSTPAFTAIEQSSSIDSVMCNLLSFEV